MTATAWPERQHDDGIAVAPWMAGAPCRSDPDLWFSEEPTDIAEAKRICTTECSFARRIACMDYAEEKRIKWGVWGGIGRDERVEKRCSLCKEVKLLAEFGPHAGTADGRSTYCEPCARDYTREYARLTRLAKAPHADPDAAREAQLAILDAARAQQTELADQQAERFAQLREQGMRIKEACEELGVTPKTGTRYEAKRLKQQTGVAA